MTRIYIAIALLIAGALGALWAHHDAVKVGEAIGEARIEAKYAKAAATAQAEQDRRATASATATISMLDYLAANLPPIEITTHEAIQRVRIVYRTSPVPAVCELPQRVREELNAARDRANAAGSPVRPADTAKRPSHP